MVLKLLEPTSGTVTYEGKDISGFQGKELLDFRRHVQPVFQNPYGSLDPMYSIYRSIEEPLRIHGIGDKKSRAARVRELLDMVELRGPCASATRMSFPVVSVSASPSHEPWLSIRT